MDKGEQKQQVIYNDLMGKIIGLIKEYEDRDLIPKNLEFKILEDKSYGIIKKENNENVYQINAEFDGTSEDAKRNLQRFNETQKVLEVFDITRDTIWNIKFKVKTKATVNTIFINDYIEVNCSHIYPKFIEKI